MAQKDAITGRKPMVGNNRSHSMNATKRRFNLNLQKITIIENGHKQKVRITTKTARTLKKFDK